MPCELYERGQTQLDFVLGFSIFIIAVMFVFMMAPGLLTPFSDGQAASPLTADRIADDLSKSTLVESGSTSEIDPTLLDDDDEVATAIGISDNELDRINISVVDTETGSLEASAGPRYPTDSGQVTFTHRIVMVEGETHWLEVRVW